MKFTKMAMTATALFASTLAFAGSLSSSSNITFLAFDGQKVKKKQSLQVNDGKQHQVVVEVSSIYQSGSDSQFFESSPIILTFQGSTEDVNILAPNLRSHNDVEQFKNNPTFRVQTASGKPLTFKQDYLKGEGFMPNARILENLANYNEGEGVAAVKQFAIPMTAMMTMGNSKASKGKVMVQGENIAEQQLQYWFQQADKETQKRFLAWANKQ
ncbi:MAG: DUF2057 domain-containing protein [Pasteurellaceae bacterium]|nr:DUF2057 domain-containing protein [Pasteurellaceae bacterium]